MTTREEVVSTVRGVFKEYQPRIPYQPGFMGDSDAADAAVNTNRENYYWVRYPYANSTAVPTLCVAANVPKVAGFKVKVGRLPWMPDKDQVLGPADERLDGVNPVEGSIVYPGTTAGYAITDGSSANSGFLGLDPIYIDTSQILPLSVQPSTGLSVQIMPGTIPRPGADINIAYQVLDLTSHVPGSGARYVLISYDSTGAVVVTDGSINSGGFAALTNADIPDTPAGNWRSAAIVLYTGQTTIVRTSAENDFLDLRFPEEQPAATSPGHTIEDEGTPLTQRTNLNFVGAGVTATDDSGNDATIVTIPATVTSVGLSMPAEFSVSGSPVTSSGTLAVTKATESANTVWAGPTSGSAAAPAFRALTLADMPSGVSAGQIIGIARWDASASQTNFDMPDTAEQLNIASDNGSITDPATVSLSSDHTQIIFDTGITAGHIVTAEYVIAQV